MFAKGLAHARSAVDGVFDAHAVCHFVKHHIAEEGIKGDVFALFGCDEHVRNRHKDVVELGFHAVFELQLAGSFLQVHAFVVGQVDGNGFTGHVAVAGIKHGIIGIEVGISAGHFFFIHLLHRELLLQVG